MLVDSKKQKSNNKDNTNSVLRIPTKYGQFYLLSTVFKLVVHSYNSNLKLS